MLRLRRFEPWQVQVDRESGAISSGWSAQRRTIILRSEGVANQREEITAIMKSIAAVK